MMITLLILLIAVFNLWAILKIKKKLAKRKSFETLKLNLKKGYKVTVYGKAYTFIKYDTYEAMVLVLDDNEMEMWFLIDWIESIEKCALKPIIIDDVNEFMKGLFDETAKQYPKRPKREHKQYQRQKEKEISKNRTRNKIARKSRQINSKKN